MDEVSYGRAAAIWWGIFWRWLLMAVAAALVLGLVIGTVCSVLDAGLDRTRGIGQVAGVLVTITAAIVATKFALCKHLRLAQRTKAG